MKAFGFPLLLVACVALCLSGLAAAADLPASGAKKKGAVIAYQPPLRGAPLSRVGGGTRSIQAADLQVEVLAPEHTGLTIADQPLLYWYCSKAITVPVEFSLVRPNVPEPVLEIRLEGPFEPGIHVVDLRKHGAKLVADTDYEWFISVVFDPAQRSNDVTAGAGIRLVAAQDPVRVSLAGGPAGGAEFAQAGVWYDAIAALSDPADPDALAQRAALLEQVGLGDAAAAR